jgi:hypothetical protein
MRKKNRLNCEMIWKIWKKIVKWYWKYGWKLWNDMENMEERQVEMWKDMDNMEEMQVK